MEYKYELITMPDGQTTLAKLPLDTNVRLLHGGGAGTHQTLDITEAEYQEAMQKAATHDLQFDTMTHKIMFVPKSQAEADQ